MAPDAILALDVGTSSAKALVVSLDDGRVLGRAGVPVALAVTGPGCVEQDPVELAEATVAAAVAAVRASGEAQVVGVAIANQRESVVMWDRSSGEPVGPVLSWQDSRTAESLSDWSEGDRARVRELTGLTVDAMYSAPKMRWLLDEYDARGRDVVIGTVDSWIVHALTGNVAIEIANASRTLLLSLATGDWDTDLLDAFAIPRSVLPDVYSSDARFGLTRAGLPLPAGLPVCAVMADSHAALFAYGAAGEAKATYGTGTSLMTRLPRLSTGASGVDTTIAWSHGRAPGSPGATYAREGNILATGQAIDWTASLIDRGASLAGGIVVSEAAATVEDSAGVTLVPAFTGLGAPHWDRSAVAILSGMTSQTSSAHLARAALECVAHQVVDVVDALESDGQVRVDVLHVDGGVSSSDLLVQIQADLLGRPVVRSREPALSAVGVARLGAETLGYRAPELATDAPVSPQWDERRRREARGRWREEVARARFRGASGHVGDSTHHHHEEAP